MLLGGGRGGFPMDPPFDVRLSGGGLVDFLAPPLSPLSVVPVVLLLTDFCFALMREKSTRKKGEREMCVERKRKRFSQKLRVRRTRGEKSESARESETKRIFSESSSPSSESKCFEFYARKKRNTPRNERDEIKRALLPPDFCPPDASLSFFSVSSGMNRFGVSVFRLLLRSVIVCVRLRFFVTNTCLLSKNTPKKQEIRESFVSTRAHTSSASRSKRA